MEVDSGRVLCRGCYSGEGSPKVMLGPAGTRVLEDILRRHPSQLAGTRPESGGVSEVGRLTSAALAAHAEGPFRTVRFLEVLEGGA